MPTPEDSTAYVFDNAAVVPTRARFESLAALFDPVTFRHFDRLGVTSGWRCWEVGGGGGTVARELAHRCGTAGRVLATDIDTRFMADAVPGLEVRRHDVATDACETDAFDLVHARLLLDHLPDREKALDRMIDALKPGGVLLVEEFDSLSMVPAPEVNSVERLLIVQQALWKIMMARGVDRLFGRQLAGRFAAHGLDDVVGEGHLTTWRGGSHGAMLLRANFMQLRDAMVSKGFITPEQFEKDLETLADPAVMNPSPILWTVAGKKKR